MSYPMLPPPKPEPEPEPGPAAAPARTRTRSAGARALFATPLILVGVLSMSGEAHAQVRWDASAQVGASKRFLTSAYAQPGFGPMLTLNGHVALIPLLRVGAYVAHDVSPLESQPARRFYAAGLRAKIQAPWATDKLHGWAFAGAGYVGAYGPSESRTLLVKPAGPLSPTAGTPAAFSVAGSGGGYFEIPFGVGLGYRLRKPWEIVVELGGRVGLGFSGSLYDGRSATSASAAPQILAAVGKDTFAAFLTVGVALDL